MRKRLLLCVCEAGEQNQTTGQVILLVGGVVCEWPEGRTESAQHKELGLERWVRSLLRGSRSW